MKVAISLPHDLYERAEALAKGRKKSRSALYADALREYIHAQEDAAITAKLNEVYADEAPEESATLAALVRGSADSYDAW